MHWLCGIAMEVANGGVMDLGFYMELMPRTRSIKVQGMGYGQLRPERRSSRFENDSPRFNSLRIGTRARDLEDLDVDQEFMGFSLSQGF